MLKIDIDLQERLASKCQSVQDCPHARCQLWKDGSDLLSMQQYSQMQEALCPLCQNRSLSLFLLEQLGIVGVGGLQVDELPLTGDPLSLQQLIICPGLFQVIFEMAYCYLQRTCTPDVLSSVKPLVTDKKHSFLCLVDWS